MTRFADSEIARVKDQPISEVIGRHVDWDRAKSVPSKGDFWGCCPFHGEKTPSFHCEDGKGIYKCFGCGATGDHIRFIQEYLGKSFAEAVEYLGGSPDAQPDPETEARLAAERECKRREQDAASERYREEERRKAYAIWREGRPLPGTEAEAYLAARGLAPVLDGLRLRYVPSQPYWHQKKAPGEKKPKPYVLYSGPALLSPMTRPDGTFAGVHITWFDPDRPGKKLALGDPETGEILPAKKIRGSKRQAAERLIMPAAFDRLVIGEGRETVLSAARAEKAKRPDRFVRTAFWASIDLQHMGGKATETVAHPTLKTATGRPARVPGPVPDMSDEAAIPLPDFVREVITLGDGDSDRFTAEQVHARAAARWAMPGRTIVAAWAPEGKDFNDLAMEGA
ncbi:DNA primase [Stappia sp. F7233]|uniref:DNA primase n=1 Tax=Stappia albiluteola TaxID=2758565 RepID=A0A839AKW6_9HYPH|nr:CHC2 zinc finger domain-containing protein [Stappia albiluteola]MBA5779512.1 DNA primase [Stappia albiluteola]